ncbi:MAG TPA: MDR family MFS transporter, partial [Blastocatellia bacterium]|nr:MDR family MFS transporter [Blastocatellia bacterium]
MQSTDIELTKRQPTDWRTKITLIGVALGIFMAALESTIVGTAMPTVVATLGGIELYSWVAVAYILTSTIMTPIWGKTADLIGRRPAFFGGMGLFLVGSALSGAAHSMAQLIAFRALQGLGAGALFPVGMTIVADLLPLETRAKMIGLFSGMWGVASLFGPQAGGYLTDSLSWRWVFYINLPFGLIAAAMIWAAYAERGERRPEIKLDYAGTATITVALTLLLLAVEKGQEFGATLTAVSLTFCALLVVLFIRIESRSHEPLIPLDIFHNRVVIVTTTHGLFAGMMLFGSMIYLPLFIQAVIGTTATQAGEVLTPYILAWVAAAIVGGRLMLRLGYRPIVIAGMLLTIAGSLPLARVDVSTTRLYLTFAVIPLGMGGGLTLASLMIGAQHSAPRARLGVVTSTVQFARSIGAALGVGVMGAVMSWRLARELARGGGELAGIASRYSDIAALVRQTTRAALSPASAAFMQRALASSLRASFLVGLAAVAVAAVIALLIPAGQAHELIHPEHHKDKMEPVAPEI